MPDDLTLRQDRARVRALRENDRSLRVRERERIRQLRHVEREARRKRREQLRFARHAERVQRRRLRDARRQERDERRLARARRDRLREETRAERRRSRELSDPPRTSRAVYRHEDIRAPKGYVRIRTIRAGSHEVRIGVRPDGTTEAISVLHPKNEPAWLRGEENERLRGLRSHRGRHSHGHHAGGCGPDCRAGRVNHGHSSRRRRRRR